MKAMQFINSFSKITNIFLLLFFISSCGGDKTIKERAEKVTPISIIRFEQDLIPADTNLVNADFFNNLNKKYKTFYIGYCENTLGLLPQINDPDYAKSISGFVKFEGIRFLKHDVDSVFPNLNEEEAALSLAMDRYKKEFKNASVPQFISYLSEFIEAQCAYDSIIGISLDMYLGKDYLFYPENFPGFMRAKMRRNYIVPNTLKSLAIANFDRQLKDKRFLAYMLFEGKVRYFAKKLLPEINDTLIFGYTNKQMAWCNESESQLWEYIIEKKLLYQKNPSEYMRFLTDGPFTSADGIPQESAPMIGTYTGYKIIENYADKSGASLEEIMNETDWDKILKESKYRPK
jgi:hypothetical protein